MILTGIGDEAGSRLDAQLDAARELGWRHLELRTVALPGFEAANLHDIPDAAFDAALRSLDRTGIRVWCFGSTILNWSKRVTDSFEPTVAEVRRAIPRLQRTGTRFVRIMSCKPAEDEFRIPAEVFRRVREVTQRFLDAGLQPLHENCMNYGGMSWQHALELLDKCPGLKWVFDTGNPLLNEDRSKSKPWPKQDPWEFWEHLREHTLHIHVKDARMDGGTAAYTWPGEGQARVRKILGDARRRGYSGAVSIEPHMVSVFHEPGAAPPDESAKQRNFIEYGRVLERLVKDLN